MNGTGECRDPQIRDLLDKPCDREEARMAQATEWFLRLREDSVTEQTVVAWTRWCEIDPLNVRCYREVQKLWSLAGDAGVAAWPTEEEVRADAYDPVESVQVWRARSQGADRSVHGARWIYALAATVLLAIAGWQLALYLTRLPAQGVYATERGETRELRLHDGSRLTLGGSSRVRIDYDAGRRHVHLESGEAYFGVRRDRNRPFVVTAAALEVTALGTAFVVRADQARTVVSVTEGLVQVARAGGAGADPAVASQTEVSAVLRAQAGEQVTVDGGAALVLSATDVSAAIAWLEGALAYFDEPLQSVVARLNRYSPQQVIVADAEAAALRFTGTVFQDRVFEWARGLERVFPVQAVLEAPGRIVLRSAAGRTDAAHAD